MVMYAPGGMASLIMMNLRVASFGKLRELWPSYLGWLAAPAWWPAAGRGPWSRWSTTCSSMPPGPEIASWVPRSCQGCEQLVGRGFVLLTGRGLFELCTRRSFVCAPVGHEIQEFIEKEIKRRER
jgi:branched-chain amino acid transport system permease protein